MKISDSNVLTIIIKLILIGLIASWLTRITSIPFYWPGILLLLLYTFHRKVTIFTNKLFLVPFSVGLLLLLYNALGHFNNVPSPYLFPLGPMSDIYPFMISALVLLNIEFNTNKERVINNVSKFSFFAIFIAVSISFITEVTFPGTSRSGDLSKVPRLYWSMGFGMFYALPFVATIVISGLKGYYKHITAFIFLTFCAYTGFLTLTLFMVIAISLSYFETLGKFGKRLYLLLIVSTGIGILVVGASGLAATLLSALPNEVFAQKAEQLLEINNSVGGDVEDLRGDVYSVSLNTFYENPIIGGGDYSEGKIGYHSFWLDKLGFLGLLGTIPYLIIIVTFYQYIKQRYFPNDKIWFRLNILLFFLLLLNPFQFWDFWIIIYVIVPIIRLGIPKKIASNSIKRL